MRFSVLAALVGLVGCCLVVAENYELTEKDGLKTTTVKKGDTISVTLTGRKDTGDDEWDWSKPESDKVKNKVILERTDAAHDEEKDVTTAKFTAKAVGETTIHAVEGCVPKEGGSGLCSDAKLEWLHTVIIKAK
ncbi:hypothetical protein GQ42DRAFT_27873 [Ramicandelaber brevisporus]|nr:hypothetical protein GQ42DRAFT_27873 [Ramicandelaber brevisporus]